MSHPEIHEQFGDMKVVVNSSFTAVAASGVIEKAVEEHIKTAVLKSIAEQFCYGSPLKKEIDQMVSVAMQIDFSSFTLPTYGDLIKKMIARAVDTQLETAVSQKLESDICKMLIGAPPEITLDKLIEDFKAWVRDRSYTDHGGRISLHVEGSTTVDRYWMVCMDPSSDVGRHQCSIQFQVTSEGEMFGLRIDSREVDKTLFVGSYYAFERDLFRMYAAGTKLLVEHGDYSDHITDD